MGCILEANLRQVPLWLPSWPEDGRWNAFWRLRGPPLIKSPERARLQCPPGAADPVRPSSHASIHPSFDFPWVALIPGLAIIFEEASLAEAPRGNLEGPRRVGGGPGGRPRASQEVLEGSQGCPGEKFGRCGSDLGAQRG